MQQMSADVYKVLALLEAGYKNCVDQLQKCVWVHQNGQRDSSHMQWDPTVCYYFSCYFSAFIALFFISSTCHWMQRQLLPLHGSYAFSFPSLLLWQLNSHH